MFKNLGDIGMVRTPLQAFGFYIAYFISTVILAMLIGIAVSITTGPGQFTQGVSLGAVVSGVVCSGLSFFILKRKNMLASVSSIAFIFIAAILGLAGGGIIGLAIPAYLTTRKA
jgi:apolipoprotein N-acyltransferase